MKVHIANWFEAERYSAIAGEAMPLGAVCKITNVAGVRTLMKLLDGDTPVSGEYAIALKVSADPYQVDTTTVPTFIGDRTVTISLADGILAVRKAIIEYDASMLHASLDPARAGTLPAPLDTLSIKGSLPCVLGFAGANAHGPLLRCYEVLGTKVRIEMIEPVVIA